METLSFGPLRFPPECVVIFGVQGLHGLMCLILISHMFAFFKTPDFCEAWVFPGGGGGGGGGVL